MSFAEIMWYTFLISSITLVVLCLILIIIYCFVIKEPKEEKRDPSIIDEYSKRE